MNDKDYQHYKRIAARISAILEKNEIVLLSDYLREFNQGQKPGKRIPLPTAAQACREGRIPGIQIGSVRNSWLVPKGAIDAAREAGMLFGKRGRPSQARYIGTCPVCGREVRGTARKMTVRHFDNEGQLCTGHKQPLKRPTLVE